jgi:putative ABC transport system permease protein
MLRIAFQGLRGRKGPFIGAFIALAVAAALVMACGTLLEAGLRSEAPVERYSAAPLVVAGNQNAKVNPGKENEDSIPLLERARVASSLVPRLAGVPGVRDAIADLTIPAALLTARGAVEGPTGHPTAVHPWASAALTPYALRSGHAPLAADELVVDAGMASRGGLRVGQRVRLASNGPARAMTVVGIAGTGAKVERQGVMFVTTAEAERLAALPGSVDAIGILPAPGVNPDLLADRLREALDGRGRVVSGASRGEVEHVESIEAKEAVIAIGGTFGGIALVIAMFVVASTIGLSVLQRQREVALLRAVAATPKQVRRMIRWEALLVGLVASAVGVIPGALLAGALGRALSDRGIAPEDMVVAPGIVPVIAAVGGTMVTALIAVAAAGRRAARVRPTEALQESSAEPRLIAPIRIVGGLLAIAAALALMAVSASSDSPSTTADTAVGISFALVLGVALLGPLVARVAALLIAPLLARTNRVGGQLAISNIRTSSRQFASAVTPLVLTVALSSTMIFVATTRQHATSKEGDERVTADVVLQSDGVGIPRSAVHDARRIPGVATAVGTAATTLGPSLGATYRTTPAAVLDPSDIGGVLDLDVRSGSMSDMTAETVALSQTRADEAHAEVGDRVSLALGDGARRQARVVAIYERDLGFGEVVLPTAMAAGHATSPLLDSVLIRTAAGTPPAKVAARLDSLSARYPSLTVGDSHDLAVRVDEDRESNDWLFRILAGIVFAFTAIAVVNTLMMIGLHRTRELALLRLIGGTARQVRSMARWEAAMLVTLGVGLGAAIALITLIPTSSVISGSPVPHAPIGLVALVLGSSAAVGVIGTQIATRLALRARPVDAIGVRD